jgi:pimeloyl-ACP methyl ester carboxylesterase
MKLLTSSDGTQIACEQVGQGPSLVLVDGAFCRRDFGPMRALAASLSNTFTVYHYDRRGRGDSSDTKPYHIDREIEDLRAVVDHAGGSPNLYGISSGAALSLLAVGNGVPVRKLAVFEPPFALDGTHVPDPVDYREQIGGMLAAGRRDDAVKLFMKVVGVPAFGIFMMRLLPNVWPKLRAVAHTLPYDFAALGATQSGEPLPTALREAYAKICVPTLALAGGKSPAWMQHNAEVIAQAVPGARAQIVPGQDHNVAAKALAPVLRAFFA